MPDVPGTGAAGLFQGPGRVEVPPAVPLPTEPQALATLEARGTALLLGMLSRLQRVEGILRLERIERLSAEETVRVTVIDNEEAQALIIDLQLELSNVRIELSDAVVDRGNLRELINNTATLANRALESDPLLTQPESTAAFLVLRVRNDLAAVLGIPPILPG